jgi:hypothetical protein
LLIGAVIAASSATALAQEVTLEGRCHPTYKKTVDAKGPCTVQQPGATVSIKSNKVSWPNGYVLKFRD